MNRIFIDVREPQEYAGSHVEGAINIPPAAIMSGSSELDTLSKNDELILYCVSGSRSNVSIQILKSKGYTNLVNGINKDQVAAKYGLAIVP